MLTAIDPTTEERIHEVAGVDATARMKVMERAEAAYRGWRKTSFGERAEFLRAVAAYMRDHVESLAPLMTKEMGKPIREARGEVNKAAWCAEHYADHAVSYLASDIVGSDATRSYVQYLPLGPVLGILPWNAPFWLAFRFCAPALMAGNTCVIKHDPHVPLCAEAIARVFDEAGAPKDILQNVYLENDAVEAAIRDPHVRAVSFTGSARTGGIVASIAASEIKPAVLELGGSDPCIVLADADLDEAADVIKTSRIINAGQSCIAAKRIIVEASVYDAMVDKLHERFAALRVGDPSDETTDVGPIARADLRDELHRQVRTTIKTGARCVLGGTLPDDTGYFYPVTVLADVTQDMPAAREETFGPVGVVMKALDSEQALEMANDTPYGLAASVWSTADRGEAMARELEAGQVAVNGIVKTDPRLPSGGIKRSGYGRELGKDGIHAFVNAQQVWIGPKQN